MRNLPLSSNLIGLDGFMSTYHGNGDTSYTLNEDMIDQDFEEGYIEFDSDYYWMHFDNDKYMSKWNELSQDFLEELIFEAINDFCREFDIDNDCDDILYTSEQFSSPKEYNFKCDVNYFQLSLSDEIYNALLEYVSTSDEFTTFLKEHYTSYDGFMSFTANNMAGFLADIAKEELTAYGAMIRFILERYCDQDNMACSYSEYFCDEMYSEYVNYDALEQFKTDVKNGDITGEDIADGEKWERKIYNDLIGDSKTVKKVLSQCYIDLLNIDQTVEKLEEILKDSSAHLKNIVKSYFKEIEDNSGELFA